MESDYLKTEIKKIYDMYGNNMYYKNADFIIEQINNNDGFILPINLTSIEKGKFYFIFYDLSGKSSKMEKFNPLLIIDWFDINNSRYLYAVSINFIPVNIRTVFFNIIINHNLNIIEENLLITNIEKEKALDNINFTNIYKLLHSIGFEWCIRKFDYKLVNKIYSISTKILPQFITMSTVKLTGVDDLKLVEIWQKKIKEQDIRQQKMIDELLNNYKTMENELNNKYLTLDKKNDNLEKSFELIKKIF